MGVNSLLLPLAIGRGADILSTVRTRLAQEVGAGRPTTAAETAALLSRFQTRKCSNTLVPRCVSTANSR